MCPNCIVTATLAITGVTSPTDLTALFTKVLSFFGPSPLARPEKKKHRSK
jgi:hypothetical protein